MLFLYNITFNENGSLFFSANILAKTTIKMAPGLLDCDGGARPRAGFICVWCGRFLVIATKPNTSPFLFSCVYTTRLLPADWFAVQPSVCLCFPFKSFLHNRLNNEAAQLWSLLLWMQDNRRPKLTAGLLMKTCFGFVKDACSLSAHPTLYSLGARLCPSYRKSWRIWLLSFKPL